MQILATRGWQLADEELFARVVCAELAARFGDPPPSLPLTAIERAAIHQYCFILYEACADSGSSRQRRAFVEIWNRLYGIAVYQGHRPDLGQELSQRALIRIWERLAQCADHGSFLRWCDIVLLSVIREHFREEWTKTETMEGESWEPKEMEAGLELKAPRGEPGMPEMIDVFAKELYSARSQTFILK
jgi:hypothetical protein